MQLLAQSRTRATPRAPVHQALPHTTAGLAAIGDRSALQVLRALETGPRGLTEDGAEARLARDGANQVAAPRPPRPARRLLAAFHTPFLLVLGVLDAVFAISGEIAGVASITAMIMIAAVMRFWQEHRTSRTVEALRALVLTTATVVRRAEEGAEPVAREVPFDQLAAGDVLRLGAGDLIPADLRLLRSKDLFLDQSTLTGESMPVGKHAELTAALATVSAIGAADAADASDRRARDPLGHRALCLAGTHVLSGTGTAVVIATGERTYLAGLGREITARRPPGAFDRGVASVSWMLLRFMAVLVPLVAAVSGLATGHWTQALLFALAVAVGLTPEMLPVVVTTTLARGANAMARRRVIVKRLSAIQDLGAMDLLCIDKTGTLTEGVATLRRHLDAAGREDDVVLEYAYLNSLLQTGWRNPLDEAVVERAELAGFDPGEHAKVDEIPFDFARRRMSVVLAEPSPGLARRHLIITKGSVEEVTACCTDVLDGGACVALDSARRAELLRLAAAERAGGLHVLAVAVRSVPASPGAYGPADESGLTLVGLLGFADPVKDSAAAALAGLRAHGIGVKVITGDDPAAAARVCRLVGLDPGEVVDGRDLAALDDKELRELAGRTVVFAKADPTTKARIVASLRAAGRIVGYLGDGVNDAPALHAADIGISVADATDLARESADVILLDKDLTVLAEGVAEGRRTFANSLKYIKAATSSNLGNVVSVTAAAAFLPFLPMLPVQLLVQNLVYDLSQLALPFDRVDPAEIAAPQRWNGAALRRFVLRVGPLSSIFDLATWTVLWFVFGAGRAHPELFQTGWFVEGLLSQVLAVHVIRTRRAPFPFRRTGSRPSRALLAATCAAVAFGLAVPFTALAGPFGMHPLPLGYYGVLPAILLAYLAVLRLGTAAGGYRLRRHA
jgi:P-type Mg2+ transporter